MKFILFCLSSVFCLIMAAATHAQETPSQKDMQAYHQCVNDALRNRIGEMAKNNEPGEKLKELESDGNTIYAQCQTMPGKNAFTFNAVYCGNMSALGLAVEMQKRNPKALKFIQAHEKDIRSESHPWYEAQKCLAMTPGSILETVDSFAQSCKAQMQSSMAKIETLGRAESLETQDLVDVANAYLSKIYNSRKCLQKRGMFDK